MNRALFLLELRRTAVQVVTLTAAVLLAFMVVEAVLVRAAGRSAVDVSDGIDLIAICLAAGAGLVLGAQAFAGEARRRELGFLFALPLGRRTLASLILAARYVAGCAGFVVLVLLRPSVLGGRLEVTFVAARLLQATPVVLAAVAHLALLAIGALAGTITRRVSLACAAAVPLIAIAGVETIVDSGGGPIAPLAAGVRLLVLVTGLLALTVWHVGRGDTDLRSGRARGYALAAGFTLAYLAIFQRQPYTAFSKGLENRPLSYEACRFATVEHLDGSTDRISVFDTRTGARLGRVAAPTLKRVSFSPDGSAMWLESNRHHFSRLLDLMWPRAASVFCWTGSDRLIGPFDLPHGDIRRLEPDTHGRALIVVREESGTHLLSAETESAGVHQLLFTPTLGLEILARLGDDHVLSIFKANAWNEVYLVRYGGVTKIDAPKRVSEPAGVFRDVDGRIYTDPAEWEAAQRKRSPGGPANVAFPEQFDGTHGWGFGWEQGTAHETLRLYALDRPGGVWREVESAALASETSIDVERGIAVYTHKLGSGFVVTVFDAGTGRRVDAMSLGPDEIARPHATDPDRGAWIAATRDLSRWSLTVRRSTLRGVPGKDWVPVVGDRRAGTIRVGTARHDDFTEMIDAEGNAVVRDRKRRCWVLKKVDGEEVELKE